MRALLTVASGVVLLFLSLLYALILASMFCESPDMFLATPPLLEALYETMLAVGLAPSTCMWATPMLLLYALIAPFIFWQRD